MAYAPITWAQATSPILWSNIGIDWDTPAKANSVSIAIEGDVTLSSRVVKSESISFALDAGQTLVDNTTFRDSITFAAEGDGTVIAGFTFPVSITFGADVGYTQSDDGTYRNSISMAADAGVVNNVVHPESITFAVEGRIFPGEFYAVSISVAAESSMSLDSGFLWNEVGDVTTTWTKVDYPN